MADRGVNPVRYQREWKTGGAAILGKIQRTRADLNRVRSNDKLFRAAIFLTEHSQGRELEYFPTEPALKRGVPVVCSAIRGTRLQ